jgi:hypothetical protein
MAAGRSPEAAGRRPTSLFWEVRFVNDESGAAVDHDAAQLKALGYESKFDRTMSKWENFSLGFTYLSPVVGVYTLFASAFVAGGPPMWWTYILVGLGQLMVCLVFGEIVSQFPISGGLYPWARRLVGKRWAWMAGWVYAWALNCTMAGVATGVAPFLAQLFDRAQSERHALARPGGNVRIRLRVGRRHRRRRLPARIRAAPALEDPPGYDAGARLRRLSARLPGLLAGGDVLLLRLRSLR